MEDIGVQATRRHKRKEVESSGGRRRKRKEEKEKEGGRREKDEKKETLKEYLQPLAQGPWRNIFNFFINSISICKLILKSVFSRWFLIYAVQQDLMGFAPAASTPDDKYQMYGHFIDWIFFRQFVDSIHMWIEISLFVVRI